MNDVPTQAHRMPTRRTVLHEARALLGTVRITSLVAADLALIHRWTRGDYARFWGMGEHTLEEVAEIYAYLSTAPTHRAYLMHLDDAACGIVQVYEPATEPVGETYPVREGDVGLHFLVAPMERRPRGLAGVLLAECVAWVFTDQRRRRIVLEPDERNAAMLSRLRSAGFEVGERVQLLEKMARLSFLERHGWEEREEPRA
jgi:penicillin G amidase